MNSEEFNLVMNVSRQSAQINRKEKSSRIMIFKPEWKNINYSYFDSSTYSIIENTTKYKNKEINNNQINLNISIILSFLLLKCDRKK